MTNRDHAAEERLTELFTPDTLLPTQYFDRLRRRSDHTGERRLMIAVLEDAVEVYRKKAGARDRRGRQLFADAEAWIESDDRSWLYSFANICDILGIDASYLREGLRLHKTRIAGTPKGRLFVFPVPGDRAELRRASSDVH